MELNDPSIFTVSFFLFIIFLYYIDIFFLPPPWGNGKTSASSAEDRGFALRCLRSSPTRNFKDVIPVATAQSYDWWPGVSVL